MRRCAGEAVHLRNTVNTYHDKVGANTCQHLRMARQRGGNVRAVGQPAARRILGIAFAVDAVKAVRRLLMEIEPHRLCAKLGGEGGKGEGAGLNGATS